MPTATATATESKPIASPPDGLVADRLRELEQAEVLMATVRAEGRELTEMEGSILAKIFGSRSNANDEVRRSNQFFKLNELAGSDLEGMESELAKAQKKATTRLPKIASAIHELEVEKNTLLASTRKLEDEISFVVDARKQCPRYLPSHVIGSEAFTGTRRKINERFAELGVLVKAVEVYERMAAAKYEAANQDNRSIVDFINFCDTHHGRGNNELFEGCPIPPKTFRTPGGHRRVDALQLHAFLDEIKAALPGMRARVALLSTEKEKAIKENENKHLSQHLSWEGFQDHGNNNK